MLSLPVREFDAYPGTNYNHLNTLRYIKWGYMPIEISDDSVERLPKIARALVRAWFRDSSFFKAKVREGYRIVIPEVEREVIGLEVGDVVQVLVYPLKVKGEEGEER
jgi:hypothetical protein